MPVTLVVWVGRNGVQVDVCLLRPQARKDSQRCSDFSQTLRRDELRDHLSHGRLAWRIGKLLVGVAPQQACIAVVGHEGTIGSEVARNDGGPPAKRGAIARVGIRQEPDHQRVGLERPRHHSGEDIKFGRGADFNPGHRPSIATFYALVATIFQMGTAWMPRADTSDRPGPSMVGGAAGRSRTRRPP